MEKSRWFHDIVGRERELADINSLLGEALTGKGISAIISGEAGIGKTRLVDEFVRQSEARNIRILRGEANSDSSHPLQVFSSALDMTEPLLQETESITFTALFAVNNAGLLVAQSASESENAMDADIFAGMLSAVQNFVRDSFDSSDVQHGSLGRMEYGIMKIIIKHGEDLFLAAVLSDQEHEQMGAALERTVESIELKYGNILKNWSGRLSDAVGIQDSVNALASRRFPVRRDLVGLKLENERNRIANVVFEKLVDMNRAEPIILLLEDLHWADESSLTVLNYLARNIGQQSILLLGTCRPGESQALDATVGRMRKESIIRELTLGRLDSGGVKALVNAMLAPNDLPEEFMDRIAEHCAGNPFFVSEIIKQMTSEGSISLIDSRYVIVRADYSIPETIEEVVQKRLESLDSGAMSMVEYLSCIGTYFDRAAAMSIPSLREPEIALDKLIACGIIINQEDASFFCHAIFQDVTYRSIADRWRLSYHRSIGEHFEVSCSDSPDERLYELARHFYRSSDRQKAYSYCLKAADLAESSFAPEQAISLLTDALSIVHVQKLGDAEPDTRVKLSERIADLAELMGDYDLAMSRLGETAAASALTDSETRARSVRKMMHLMEVRGRYDDGLKAATRAKELLGERRNHEMALILMNEGTIYEQKRELERAIGIQKEALAIMNEIAPGHKDVARIHSRIGTCYWMKNDFDAALDCYLKARDISDSNRDQRGIAASMNNIGIVYIRKGDYNNAADYLGRGRDIYQKIGDQSGMASASGNLGNVYIAKGDYRNAMAAYDICLKVFTRLGARMALGMTLMNIGSIHEHMGEFDRAMEFYRKSWDIREGIGDRRGLGVTALNIGNLLFDMEDYEGSLEQMEKAMEMVEGISDHNGIIHSALGIARARMKLDRPEGCIEQIEKALSLSRDLGMEENEKTALVLYGRLAVRSGDWEKAEKSFTECIEYGRNGGYRRIMADALWGFGMMMAARKDRTNALGKLEEARELYVEMKQPHLLREIDADIAAVSAKGHLSG